MQLPDRRGRDEAVLTSRPVDGAAPPFDPAPDEPDHTPPARRRARWGGLGSRLRPGVLAAIAAGGALGGAARYGIQHALPAARDQFPWATFAVNVTGSLALAVLLVFVLEIWPPTRYARPFAAIGFLGAYTTFSTWMVETAELVAHGRAGLAVGYLGGSLAGRPGRGLARPRPRPGGARPAQQSRRAGRKELTCDCRGRPSD